MQFKNEFFNKKYLQFIETEFSADLLDFSILNPKFRFLNLHPTGNPGKDLLEKDSLFLFTEVTDETVVFKIFIKTNLYIINAN